MSLSSSSTILEGFQEERDIIASIYFDSFQSSEKNDGYLVTINPYADDCNDSSLPRSRFPLFVTVKVSPRLLLQSASAFEYPHVGAPLPWFSPQRAGLYVSSIKRKEKTFSLDSFSFTHFYCFQEWDYHQWNWEKRHHS
ncbi:MAG: hypothetical protein Q8P67_07940 [archaeon]|nr:hypothetical protein [archaeon]